MRAWHLKTVVSLIAPTGAFYGGGGMIGPDETRMQISKKVGTAQLEDRVGPASMGRGAR